MAQWLPNGAGELLGDPLVTNKHLVCFGAYPYFVGSTNASDTNNTGHEPMRPLATLGAAITAASAYDMIILRDGHAEALAGNASKNGLVIVGSGSVSGNPTVNLTPSVPNTSPALIVSANDVEIRNIKFGAQASANTVERVRVAGHRARFRGCRFECNGNDDAPAVKLMLPADALAASIEFDSCTFVSTATDIASRPQSAVLCAAVALHKVVFRNCILDGGTVGFDNTDLSLAGKRGLAVDLLDAASLTMIRVEGQSQLFGADFAASESAGTLGYIQVSTITGGAVVSLD